MDHSSALVSSCHGAVAVPVYRKLFLCVRRSAMIGNTSRLTKAGWRASSRVSAVPVAAISAVMTAAVRRNGGRLCIQTKTGQTAIPSGSLPHGATFGNCPLPRTQTYSVPADAGFSEHFIGLRFAPCGDARTFTRRVAPESARRQGRH